MPTGRRVVVYVLLVVVGLLLATAASDRSPAVAAFAWKASVTETRGPSAPVSAPDATPAATDSSRPFIVESPPPEVVDRIRDGLVPNATLADLARSMQDVRGAPALAQVAPFVPKGPPGAAPAAASPIVGVDHSVVLLVQYGDQTAAPVSTPSMYQSMLFGLGPGSMRSYYKENSYNQYDIQGSVTNWVSVGHNRNWYADYDGVPNTVALCGDGGGSGDDYGCGPNTAHNTQTLIRDAVLAADPYVDFSAYAVGGVVRNLVIIHAGQGADANQSCRVCAWSVAWGPASPVVVDGVTVQSALVVPEYVYTPGDSTIGVFAHELGHLAFGLPDLYDTDYSSAGVGPWSLMGFGSWQNGGATPAHLDAWSKIRNGWITPTIVNADGPMNIPAVETSPTVLELWTNGSAGSEYFLVENREQTGFDQYLPGSGLLIWHIDEFAGSNSVDCHPKVLLVPADSGASLPCNLSSRYGSSANPWPGSLARTSWSGGSIPSSRSYAGSETGVALQAISIAGSTMTAGVSVMIAGPTNDNLANAHVVSGLFPWSYAESTVSATLEAGEPQPCGNIGATVWFAVTPGASGTLTVDTFGSSFDTVLAAYQAAGGVSPPGTINPTALACNDDTAGVQSQISFPVTAGAEYFVQAGGYGGATGSLQIHMDCAPSHCAVSIGNDNIAAAAAVPLPLPSNYGQSTIGATLEPGEPQPCGNIASTVWFTYTATAAGTLSVSSAGSNFDTVLAVYNAASAPPAIIDSSALDCNDDNGSSVQSRIQVRLYPGKTYYVQAGGYLGASGYLTLSFTLLPDGELGGTITDPGGAPVAGASVTAFSFGWCCSMGAGATGSDGSYVVTGLSPACYVVSVSAPGYSMQYYAGTFDWNAAAHPCVSSGLLTPGVSWSLLAPSMSHPLWLSGLPFTDVRNTAGATLEPGESQPCGNVGGTVWYEYAAPASQPGYQTVSVDTVGSGFSTAVAVYTFDPAVPSPPGALMVLGCGASGSGSSVTFSAQPGSTYFFQIGGQNGATGNLAVNVSPDTDSDGYTDVQELRLGKDPNVFCQIMRADVSPASPANGNGVVTLADLILTAQRYNQIVPPAPARFDQNGDSQITLADLILEAQRYNQSVSSCP